MKINKICILVADLLLPGLGGFCIGGETDSSPLVRKVIEGPEGYYFTYPHVNGFMDDGRTMIIARKQGGMTEFLKFDAWSEATERIASVKNVRMYYSVSLTGLLVTNANNSLVVVDLAGDPADPRVLWASTPPWRLSGLPEISPDGRTVLADFHDYSSPERHQIRRFKVGAEGVNDGVVLLEKPWLLNHVQTSPADPSWILFSHEGKLVSDRMWALNAKHAPEGVSIFNQLAPDGENLYVGHELAMHNELASLAVVFGNSPGKPTGLYKVDYMAGLAHLLSAGDRDWHCNISPDGRWAVVDTMGRMDDKTEIQPGWADNGGESDVVAVNLRTGARMLLARGTYLRSHPWHPHPHISPEGRLVVYNDAKSQSVRVLELNMELLNKFLDGE